MTTDRILVFEQDFAKVSDLTHDWHFDDGPVYNDEVQVYTLPEAKNAFIADGLLTIEARREADGTITSGRLKSKQGWVYGYFEMEAQLPRGKGTWPAFWMLPLHKTAWPDHGEIDIMEQVGYDPTQIHFSLHSKLNNHKINTQVTAIRTLETADSEFHRYGMEWQPESFAFFLDGTEVARFERPSEYSQDNWPFDAKFGLILNLAIGGMWGGKFGLADDLLPCRYLIKWVRVWQ